MTQNGSVTGWIVRAQQGDEQAFARLYERYHTRLEALARRRLGGTPRRAEDAEDVAQQVLLEFLVQLRAERIRLESRDDLLRFLSCIVACRALNLLRGEGRRPTQGPGEEGLEAVAVDLAPTPDEEAAESELLQQALTVLPEEGNVRRIGEMYLAGYKPGKIAAEVGLAPDTVTRKIKRIHLLWRVWAANFQPEFPAP